MPDPKPKLPLPLPPRSIDAGFARPTPQIRDPGFEMAMPPISDPGFVVPQEMPDYAPFGSLPPSRPTPKFECSACGQKLTKPHGRCPICRAFHTIVEAYEEPTPEPEALPPEPAQVVDFTERVRISMGSPEFDRVLGSTELADGLTFGAIPGFVYLLAGPPGIGKSTMLGQASIAGAISGPVVYGTAEELQKQVERRLLRLAEKLDETTAKNINVIETKSILDIEALAMKLRPAFVIIDSVSTIRDPSQDGAKGGVAQVKAVCTIAQRIAHTTGAAVFLIGHVTKDGGIAGPKALEHEVDCVLEFAAEGKSALRTIRAAKNRGGSTTEIGVFEMTGFGLIDVADPSQTMLRERRKGVSGSAIAALIPASSNRAMLVEVQALVSPLPEHGGGRRKRKRDGEEFEEEEPDPEDVVYTGRGSVKVRGTDAGRVATILAVLSDAAPDLWLSTRHIHVNVTSGLTVVEPAIDVAIALAIYSRAVNIPVAEDVVVFGELDLVGAIRSCPLVIARVIEAGRSNFERVIMPPECERNLRPEDIPEDLEVIGAATIVDLCNQALDVEGTVEVVKPARGKKRRSRG